MLSRIFSRSIHVIVIGPQKNPNSQSNPERKKNKARGITRPDVKLHYNVTIMKITWYWQKNRHTDEWNRIKSPEINPHIYEQITFDKGAKKKTYNGERKPQ